MEKLKRQLQLACDTFYGEATIVVKDLQTREKIEIKADERFYVASIIKLWPLWLFFKEEQEGKRDLDEKVVLNIDPKVKNMGISHMMHKGMEWTYKDLLTLMTVMSDNHCTNEIMDTLTIEKINEEMARLGVKDTKLNRKMNAGKHNWSTANDVADILEGFMLSDELNEKNRELALEMLAGQRWNTKLPGAWAARGMHEDIILRHKTGEILGSENDAGILSIPSNGKDIIIVCMTKGLSHNPDGIKFNQRVGELVFNYYM